MKAGWVRIVRFRYQKPSILSLTMAFVSPAPPLTAGSVSAAEPQPNVNYVRQEMTNGEIV